MYIFIEGEQDNWSHGRLIPCHFCQTGLLVPSSFARTFGAVPFLTRRTIGPSHFSPSQFLKM